MKQQISDSEIVQTITLLSYYGFDLKGYSAIEIMSQWLQEYQQQSWIRLAVIEALYQGRYKAVSVEQILGFWVRRNQPHFHFTPDFERLISGKLPQDDSVFPEALQMIFEPEEEVENTPKLDDESVGSESSSITIESELAENPISELSPDRNSQSSEGLNLVAHWSCHVIPEAINKFTPQDDGSAFFEKLKKIALEPLEELEKIEKLEKKEAEVEC
jgi:hypothetical protein